MQTESTNPILITKKFTKCASCGQGISSKKRYCLACTRMMAEAKIEPAAVNRAAVDTAALPASEAEIPRLGERLVAEGLVDEGMLQFALRVQAERKESGESVRLGQLLISLNLITPEVLDQVTAQQLLQTQKALRQSNRQLEERVQASTQRLKNALVKMGHLNLLQAEFMSMLSHELRDPLDVMAGCAALLADESIGSVALNEEQKSAMASLIGAAGRLGRLVDDLTQFSTASQGNLKLELERVSLSKLITRALDQVNDLAQQREVKLQSKMPAILPLVKADSHRLTWVIKELLENALKNTPAGGSVMIGALSQPDHVKVGVIDSGTGISQERVEEAFRLSKHINGSSSWPQANENLGLALAQRIIEAHGTTIDVHSKAGWGSQFTFILPSAGWAPVAGWVPAG